LAFVYKEEIGFRWLIFFGYHIRKLELNRVLYWIERNFIILL